VLRRDSFLAGVAAATLVRMPAPKAVAATVRAEFLHAWNGYKLIAWGRDEVKPVSGTANDFFIEGKSFGLSIVEALDTLFVMGFDDDLDRCVRWIGAHLDMGLLRRGERRVHQDRGRRAEPAVDSFYEYLWGGWQMLGDARCRDWYRMLTDAVLKYSVDRVDGRLWFRQVDYLTGATRRHAAGGARRILCGI
jgi:hypothetical protein